MSRVPLPLLAGHAGPVSIRTFLTAAELLPWLSFGGPPRHSPLRTCLGTCPKCDASKSQRSLVPACLFSSRIVPEQPEELGLLLLKFIVVRRLILPPTVRSA
mgnify:FL=1